ncbi:MAG: dephospho-CoA kinase [Gammaproteobacteria bacterium]|nr:dephospho-CoA kinase [Gammaproteobacteria bacterium]
MNTRYLVALTGGIGSGKTAVSDRLAALGADIVDTDRIARELVLPGSPTLSAIAGHFGAQMLDEFGRLDRARLRERIFADPEAKRWLDALMHPEIRRRLWAELAAGHGPYGVAVIPLLAEGGQTEGFDRIVVVDTPEAEQVRRVMARDGVSPTQAEAALASQATRAARLALADERLDNSRDLPYLLAQVDALHRTLLRLAAAKAADQTLQ